MIAAALLFEIGTEELPPGSLRTLGEALRSEVLARLAEHRIAHGGARWFAAPRRLALLVEEVGARQSDALTEKLGPQLSAAFTTDGKPTPAASGFARGCGVSVDQLERIAGERGERLVFRQQVAGLPTATVLPALLDSALGALPIARRMRWGAHRTEFVRPVHWVVLLHGSTVVPGEVMGTPCGRTTRGHRVHGAARIEVDAAGSYLETLRVQGYVLADHEERKRLVEAQVREAGLLLGGKAAMDDELLEEVCSLVEWPRALTGRFEERFLSVPAEALVSSMKKHQKFFPVTAEDGSLLPYFITVANLESKDPGKVVAGNERVIRPRLSDAAFFYEQDRLSTQAARRERLKDIVFQTELGSLWDKTARVASLAAFIGEALGADASLCARAGELSKSDLISEMVLEFDDLQGTMGRYYALHDGDHPALAEALSEQYLPRHAGDVLPASTAGCALALADRLDTLVGIFGIGQAPTGSRDPFALRRAALGVLRILVERELPLDLQPLLERAAGSYRQLPQASGVVDAVRDYMLERFKAWYADAGVRAECVSAVLARGVTAPLDFDRRVRAVAAFSGLAEAAALASANKRVANLLARQDPSAAEGMTIDPGLLREPAERDLVTALDASALAAAPLLAACEYTGALSVLASLREPVDAFFEQVLVNCEEPEIRANRLALLGRLRNAFLAVADISALASGA